MSTMAGATAAARFVQIRIQMLAVMDMRIIAMAPLLRSPGLERSPGGRAGKGRKTCEGVTVPHYAALWRSMDQPR